MRPVEIRAPRGARWLEIVWDDGEETRHPHIYLRAFCPCAHCQGHQGPIRWTEGAEAADLELADLEEIGNYALRLVWGDGHGTGIYTYRFLRAHGAMAEMATDEVKGLALQR